MWGQGYRQAYTPVIPLLQQGLVPRVVVDFLSWTVSDVRFSGSVKKQGQRLAPWLPVLAWVFFPDKDCFVRAAF